MTSGLSPSPTNRLIGDPERRRVLIVDDEETIRLALARFLRSRGYDVDTAPSGSDALDRLAAASYAIMICDVRMPGMTGLELLPRVRDRHPDLAIMMLTAVNDTPTAAESLALGAMEYLMKPIELGELQLAVERVLHRRNLALEQRNVERLINDEVDRRLLTLHHSRAPVPPPEAFESLARAVEIFESSDRRFAGMSARVAALAENIARALGLEPERRDRIVLAARVHDIGRLAIPAAILAKPGALTAEELAVVRRHVAVALEILEPLSHMREVRDAVREHHEHWDGGGYPNGLAGVEIGMGGRVLCAADAFVALTSPRPYREAMSVPATIAYLAERSGSLLDPAVFNALQNAVAAA